MGRGYWAGAIEAVEKYPERMKRLADLRSQKITASISGVPGGGGAARTTEDVALRQLPPAEQKDYEAVSLALAEMRKREYGKEFMKLVRMRYWQKPNYKLATIALRLHYSEVTMKRWNSEFIRLVLRFRGLKD